MFHSAVNVSLYIFFNFQLFRLSMPFDDSRAVPCLPLNFSDIQTVLSLTANRRFDEIRSHKASSGLLLRCYHFHPTSILAVR